MENRQNPKTCGQKNNKWVGSMLEFITRMGYHFRQKKGGKKVEIGRNMWAEKLQMGYHRRKIGEISPKIAFLSCRFLFLFLFDIYERKYAKIKSECLCFA